MSIIIELCGAFMYAMSIIVVVCCSCDPQYSSMEAWAKARCRYLKDHERNRVLTKGAKAFVSDDDDSDEEGPVVRCTMLKCANCIPERELHTRSE